MKIQAPCGEEATINHFKTCKHEACQKRYQVFLQEKDQIANSLFGRFCARRKSVKTLVEQIKDIHSRHFSKEFHAYRQDLIPAMVNDLKMKFFDDLLPPVMELEGLSTYWSLRDSADVRAVKRASQLIQITGLRDNTPSVE